MGMVALNAGCLICGTGLMYRRLLPTEKRRWYFDDVLLPLAAQQSQLGYAVPRFHAISGGEGDSPSW